MTFFSFSLSTDSYLLSKKLKSNTKYYSKDITLWKELNNKSKKIKLNYIQREKRKKTVHIGNKLLVFLPPSYGLGDAIEYSLGIVSLIKSRKFEKVGVAFCNKYYFVFRNIFKFKNIYQIVLSEQDLLAYDSALHLTLEIGAFNFQKYNRSDIVEEICKFFVVDKFNFKLFANNQSKIKKTISIFPTSTSPIRTLPFYAIKEIIDNLSSKFKIELFIHDCEYSNKLKAIFTNQVTIINPTTLEELFRDISKIEFGIFIDSAPLHIAKLFNKKGVLIETSVNHKTLLTNTKKIKAIKNEYKSKYCSAPCGLIDIFSINKKVGCYETNKMNFEEIKKLNSLKNLQRREKHNNNKYFLSNPVGCVKNIDIKKVIKLIKSELK